MTLPGRDDGEADALLTDRYLESLLAADDRRAADAPADASLDRSVRDAATRLRRNLVRVHPSFRFEERLAGRLSDVARSMRLAPAAGGGSTIAIRPLDRTRPGEDPGFDPLADPNDNDDTGARSRPLLIGGALTSAALSIAGAAFVAWRRPCRAAAEQRSRTGRLMPIKLPSFRPRKDAYPPDLWTKCPSCEEMLFNKQLDKILRVCPSCGHHFRLSAEMRLEHLIDHGSFRERDAGLQSLDQLGFVDQKSYPDRIAAAQLATGMRDAAVWGTGSIEGRAVAICVMDFGFMGGSMGAVVGEKVARAAEAATAERIPLIIVSASGGARMQEGTLALMQLAKTVGAIERLRAAGVPFISVLSDPTTGGVFASFAAIGDVNIAEPNALIGFAGARVTAGTIAQELPEGFQRAEFLFNHGFVDRVVHRTDLRAELALLLRYVVPRPIEETDRSEAPVSPMFRPLSFLSSLADRVIPDVDDGPNGRGEAPRQSTPAEIDRG